MKYTEQAVETLDDAGSVIANNNIEIEQLRQRVAELEKELESAYKTVDANWVSHQQLVKLTSERDALKQQRDKLLAAINFARQGYQAASENGDHDEVEWAEMYLRSIDTAIASVKEKA